MDPRARSTLTLLVLGLVLVLGIAFGWSAVTEPFNAPTTASSAEDDGCTVETVPAGEVVRPADVTVNVLNGGTKNGLAGRTLEALAGRGFGIGETANAGERVPRVQIWAEDPGNPVLRLVKSHLAAKVRIRKVEDLDPGVTVVVGDEFDGLRTKGRRQLKFGREGTVCVPPDAGMP